MTAAAAHAGDTGPAAPAAVEDQIARLEAERRELVLPRFDLDDAWHLGLLLVELARDQAAAVTVDVRRGRHQLFHAALPGTCADHDAWARRKSRVVEHFGVSSYLVGLRCRSAGRTLEHYGLDTRRYAAHGGAVPVEVTGVGMVATATVSGLAQADDHRLVVRALRRAASLAATRSSSRGPVR